MRRDREVFVAPLRQQAVIDQPHHHLVDGRAQCLEFAWRGDAHLVALDGEHRRKAPQRFGVVAPDATQHRALMGERQEPFGRIDIALPNMAQQAHGTIRGALEGKTPPGGLGTHARQERQ